ncbi:phosphogluconate dehydratase [Marinobacteraceae bacterium S3BR75-40.1]
MHPVVERVTQRIIERSSGPRDRYRALIRQARQSGPNRAAVSCTNLAHSFAASPPDEKLILKQTEQHANIAMVSAYNDLLSAHQPYVRFPDVIRKAVAREGHVAQFAAGVPAMCDGITQGQPGMELSLFSRDVIAMATAVALTHNIFDGVLCLGICDKIVPGLLIGALRFGHLPVIFVPGGPMPSGLPNKEKARIREEHAAGKVSRQALLEAEARSYHAPGTCTFYGTANTNQILMEVMGLHLPGASFVHPHSPLRDLLTEAAARRVTHITALGDDYRPVGEVVDERTMVNAMVALLATAGSTNHTIHLVAIARAAGIIINWDDLADLSRVVPLMARVYPNGEADINAFDAAGGVPFMVRELLTAGLLHTDVRTVWGESLWDYVTRPVVDSEGGLAWEAAYRHSADTAVLRPSDASFSPESGLRVLEGNLGRAIVKVSAVPEDAWTIEAPARVFHSQLALKEAYERGELTGDMVAVLPAQGPKASGMPELHKLMPILANLQANGQKVALVTDGRLSGASGKVLSAIHVTPEVACGGRLGEVANGDRIRIDANTGELTWLGGDADSPRAVRWERTNEGLGRELFQGMRDNVTSAEEGATTFNWTP